MNKAVIGLLIIAVVVGGYLFLNAQSSQPQTPSPKPMPQVSIQPDELNELQAGGSSYQDPDGTFVLLYPNDYTMDTENNGAIVRFVKRGEMERPQSEISNGVLVVIEKADTGNMSLAQWVDSRIDQITADGTTQITEGKKQIMLNGQPAFTYQSRGLGESQTYVVKKDNNATNVLIISTLVADPNNVGYQAEVDAMLETVEVLK